MPQLHLYVSEEIAAEINRRADAAQMSVSRYLADLVRARTSSGWPPEWFDRVVGSWEGDPLERAPQRDFESREEFA